MRWSILALFALGWLLTVGRFPSLTIEYSLLNLISFAGCIILLQCIEGPVGPVLPIWIGLAIFCVNHYLKFYSMVVDPILLNTPPMQGLVGTVPPTEDTLVATYAVVTCAFVSFCFVSIPFAVSGHRAPALPASPERKMAVSPSGVGILAALAMALACLKTVLTLTLNFTRGHEYILITKMPFHTLAIVATFVPSVIELIALCLIDQGVRTNFRSLSIAGMVILLSNAAIDLVLESSKSSLGRAAILLSFLWLVTGRRVRSWHVVLVAGCGIVSAVLYPFIIALRTFRITGLSMPIGTAVRLVAKTGQSPSYRYSAARLIFMRLTGADMVLALVDHHAAKVSWATVWANGGYADTYASIELFRVPVGENHMPFFVSMLTPPGLFYLRAGYIGAVVGMLVFTAAVLLAWRWLRSRRLVARPAICAFFLMTISMRFMEGDLEYQLLRALPLYVAAIVVVEFILRAPWRMLFTAGSKSRISQLVQPTSA